MKLARNIIVALIVGVIVGLILNLAFPSIFTGIDKYVFKPLGAIFLNLMKMLVVPVVFFSIVVGTVGLGNPKKLGRIGVKSIAFFLTTTAFAIIIGLTLAIILKPGSSGGFESQTSDFQPTEAPSIIDTLLAIIPVNPIQAMASGEMLQIILFAVFIGLGLTILGDKVKIVTQFVEQAEKLMMLLVNIVMKFAPYGAFGLIASAIGNQGVSALKAMGLYMVVIIIALLLHSVITYGGSVTLLAKKNPIWFFKGFAPAMVVAFSTSSSTSTLPVSLKAAQENLQVPEPISGFVQSLGATINMDGTAIMQGIATVFIAQVYGLDFGVNELLIVVLTAVLASIGTAAVPGAGLIMLAMVLESVGLPVEGIALILGVDRLADMLRTAVNITGDAACAVVVSKSEEKLLIKEVQTQ